MEMNDLNRLASHPALQELFEQANHEIQGAMRQIRVQAGMPLFRNGEACNDFLLLLEGSARVQRLSENGQVITLYHLEAGHACELTLSCLLGGRCYPAEAIAESEVLALLLPRTQFQQSLGLSPQFRRFVFGAIDQGIHGLLSLVEEVTFGHMDKRLARCLLQAAHSHQRVIVTHSILAEELGTAREVVSRLLKDFERHGWVRLHRGWIEITDSNALRELALHSAV